MTRGLVLGALVIVGALTSAVAGVQQAPAGGRQGQGAPGGRGTPEPPSARALTVDKLRDNLFVIAARTRRRSAAATPPSSSDRTA